MYSIELLNIVKNSKTLKNGEFRGYYHKNTKNYRLLIQETAFLPVNVGVKERTLYVLNGQKEQVVCPICGNKSKLDRKLDYFKIKLCSRKCFVEWYVKCDENGNSKSKQVANARKETILNNGGFKDIGRKISKSLTTVLEDGNTVAQKRGKQNSKTVTAIQADGNSIAKRRSEKSAKTMRKVKDNGRTTYENNGIRHKKYLNSIQSSGKTLAQEIGEKVSQALNTVTDSGITRGKEISLKGIQTMKNTYSENGITLLNESINRLKNHNRNVGFLSIVDKFSKDLIEYNLLTTQEEYIKSTDRLIKYEHNCGNQRESFFPYVRCDVCYPYTASTDELHLQDFCSQFLDILVNDRNTISPLELDVLIPTNKIAIEYNGLYWHNDNFKDKKYHLMKTQRCEEQGIDLLHIFENEWIDITKQTIWKSIISNKLGISDRIHGRKCDIRIVKNNEKCTFLNEQHLQGDCPSSVNIGLYYEDELVSLMSFGKSRFNKKYDWELLRFCNKLNTTVVGGASKLLKYFRKVYTGSIISYADRRRSNGNLYKQLGFEFSHNSPPNYWYYNPNNYPYVLESRVKYQKHKLSKLLPTFDNSISECENMKNNGYYRIFDCGNSVWVMY